VADPRFYTCSGPFRLGDLCARIGADVPETGSDVLIYDVASLNDASPGSLTFAQNKGALTAIASLEAAACLVSAADAASLPAGVIAIIANEPRRAFALAAQAFYPRKTGSGIHSPDAIIDPSARIGVQVDIGAKVTIGAGVEIGAGSIIGAGTIIGDGVMIGAEAEIATHVSLSHCLIGDRVTLHAGVRIGEPGFGVVPGPRGFTRVPQLGRVIIQDDADIGANTCIDRGALGDTVIGEGTWIDNLVQVGHNVRIGRYCVIAAQVGISGSVTIGDFVAIGGQAAFAPHVTVAAGAEIGAQCGVMRDVGPRERLLGTPAQPAREFFRTVTLLRKMSARSSDKA
jgi:UDP-3-O-[3-hydroxymyristoyl] glucosamine N-acyltransferase